MGLRGAPGGRWADEARESRGREKHWPASGANPREMEVKGGCAGQVRQKGERETSGGRGWGLDNVKKKPGEFDE